MSTTEREASFTLLCISEAVAIPRKNQCCRRALAYGILLGAAEIKDHDVISVKVKTEALAELLIKLIKEQFGRDAEKRKAGARSDKYEISFASRSALELLSGGAESYCSVMKCPSCQSAFFCGLLLSAVSINDPKKDYYLSLRAELCHTDIIKEAFADAGLEASFRVLGERGVFYMRQSARIEDFLAVCGMQRMLRFYKSKDRERI